MAIDVTKTKVTGSEISSDIKIDFPEGLSGQQKKKIKDEAGELIVDHILGRVGQAKSPIKGEGWPGLSKEYRAFKQAQGRGSKANLEFSGDMLDDLEFKRTRDGVRIQIKGEEAPKADGHNNFSRKSKLPRRKFMPEEGDKFTGKIDSDIDAIIADEVAKATKVGKRELRGITSKRELNSFLRETFTGLELPQIKDAILLNDNLRDTFQDVLDFF